MLFERPILNIRQMEAALSAPFPAAQRYIKKFEQLGVVRETTGRARGRAYRADAILQAIEKPIRK